VCKHESTSRFNSADGGSAAGSRQLYGQFSVPKIKRDRMELDLNAELVGSSLNLGITVGRGCGKV
jgi:hypothetical protein